MRILLSLVALAVLGSLVVMVYAEGWASLGRDGPRLPRDEELMEISPFVALLQSMQRFRLESSCETAEFLKTVIAGEPDRESHALDEFVAGIRGECELFTVSERSTEPVFQAIKAAGELPEAAYVFSLFVYDPNLEDSFAAYAEETVGLFSDLATCDRVEDVARDLGLPTRRCVVWSGGELF